MINYANNDGLNLYANYVAQPVMHELFLFTVIVTHKYLF